MEKAVATASVTTVSHHDGTTPVHRTLAAMQEMQEAAVNAGHRPDAAVRAILDLEALRCSVVRAERSLCRALAVAQDKAEHIADRLQQHRF
jgi:hypothetical protein